MYWLNENFVQSIDESVSIKKDFCMLILSGLVFIRMDCFHSFGREWFYIFDVFDYSIVLSLSE